MEFLDKIAAKKFFTSKSVIVGISLLLIVYSILVLSTSSTKEQPKLYPSPTEPQQIEPLPTTPPDKQIEGQIVVKFKAQYTDLQINEHLKVYDARITSTIQGINYKIVSVPPGKENEILEKLKSDPYVEKAVADYSTHASFMPNDTDFGLQYGLKNTGQTVNNQTGTPNADVRAEAAWDVTRGNGIKIAILDTGINLNHPEFSGKVVAQKGFATTTVEDQNGHGTHVAGIIAAGTNNGQGVAGACPDCQLIIGKVLNDTGSGATSNATAGITWAADQGAKVINMSLRTTSSGAAPLYQEAINYAIQKGVVVVVAAGNDNSSNQVWPAANTGVVSVASTTNRDQKSSFSNFGSYVKVAAPGSDIYSTLPNHTNAKNKLNYGYLSGTSMASPLVAGIVGLIWATPYGTSPTAVINRLYTTADKITGTGTYWTEGRVNAAKAVNASSPTTTVAPTTDGVPSPVCVGGVGAPPCATIPATSSTPAPTSVTTVPSNGTPPPITITVPSGAVPSINPFPTVVAPCPTTTPNGILYHKKVNSGNFLQQFLDDLFKFLEELFKQLGIGTPFPRPNIPPIPTPCP